MPNNNGSYRTVLESLLSASAEFCRFSDLDYKPSAEFAFDCRTEGSRTVILRHDIDHSTEAALTMATAEAALGVKATYFFLAADGRRNEWYNKQKRERMIECLLLIQELGHEIGFHYDVLGEYFVHGILPDESATAVLTQLRAEGLEVFGCAAHGSSQVARLLAEHNKTSERLDYINYVIWSQINKEEGVLILQDKALSLPALDLTDLGLSYEAYFIRMRDYVSDNGVPTTRLGYDWTGGPVINAATTTDRAGHRRISNWIGSRGTHYAPTLLPRDGKDLNLVSLLSTYGPGDIMQILVHPGRWR